MVSNSTADVGDARDACLISTSGRSPGVGNGNPLQHSCLENSKDKGAWQLCSPRGCKELGTTDQLTKGSAPRSCVCLHVNQ